MLLQVGFLLLVAAMTALAALVGALLGSLFGRGMAIDARIAPLQADVVALVDKFDHAAKRWAKRDRDARPAGGADPSDRLARLREIAAGVASKGR